MLYRRGARGGGWGARPKGGRPCKGGGLEKKREGQRGLCDLARMACEEFPGVAWFATLARVGAEGMEVVHFAGAGRGVGRFGGEGGVGEVGEFGFEGIEAVGEFEDGGAC